MCKINQSYWHEQIHKDYLQIIKKQIKTLSDAQKNKKSAVRLQILINFAKNKPTIINIR